MFCHTANRECYKPPIRKFMCKAGSTRAINNSAARCTASFTAPHLIRIYFLETVEQLASACVPEIYVLTPWLCGHSCKGAYSKWDGKKYCSYKCGSIYRIHLILLHTYYDNIIFIMQMFNKAGNDTI